MAELSECTQGTVNRFLEVSSSPGSFVFVRLCLCACVSVVMGIYMFFSPPTLAKAEQHHCFSFCDVVYFVILTHPAVQ